MNTIPINTPGSGNRNLTKFITADGSDTIYRADLDQHYHSTFGAIQESMLVFIMHGFLHACMNVETEGNPEKKSIHILEIGFGTGLNALLTLLEAKKHDIKVQYTAIEAFPLEKADWQELNYPEIVCASGLQPCFEELHLAEWNHFKDILPGFSLCKIHSTLQSYVPPSQKFDLVYFDAFGPDAQPELWTEQVFRNIQQCMSAKGVLTTYSVKGDVVRALQASGFLTEKLPGPPGKRHVLRAIKK
jgi:tRNA U34 5-methylaminomethyl-2-thiouridine-forming methyltransferase MnmC